MSTAQRRKMSRRRFGVGLGSLLLGPAGELVGPTMAQTFQRPFAARDDLGRMVTLQRPAERIVTLGLMPFLQMAELGVTPVGALLNPIFIANNEDIMPGWRDIKPVQNADWSVNAELVAQLNPDLIVGGSDTDGQSLSSLSPYFGLRDKGRLEPMLDSLSAVARLLDRDEAAVRSRQTLACRLAQIASIKLSPKSVVPLYVAGSGRFSALGWLNTSVELIEHICGPQKRGTGLPKATLPIGIEALLEADPDVILFWYHDLKGPDAALAALARLPLWKDVRAVRDGAVVPINGWRHPTSHSVGTAMRFLDAVVSEAYAKPTWAELSASCRT